MIKNNPTTPNNPIHSPTNNNPNSNASWKAVGFDMIASQNNNPDTIA